MILRTLLLSILTLFIAQAAYAADPEHGKRLHDVACISCHGTELYRRDERVASSYDALREEVDRWQLSMKLKWRGEDIDDVTDYLNNTFYNFDCPVRSC